MKVFVNAWHYNGGGGFDWFWTPEDADKAFEEEKKNAEEYRGSFWTAYRFDYESSVNATRETITDEQRDEVTHEIDAQLDELCDEAHRVWPDIPGFIEKARQRDLYLRELDDDGEPSGNVYLLPQGWVDEFQDRDEETSDRETYCYAPTHTMQNSPVDTLWVALYQLAFMQEIDEAEARRVHPNLFVYLEAINAGVDVADWSKFWKDRGIDTGTAG